MKPLAVVLACALFGGGAYAKDAEGCIAAAGVSASSGTEAIPQAALSSNPLP